MKRRYIYTVLLVAFIGVTISAQSRKVKQDDKQQNAVHQADRVTLSEGIRTGGNDRSQRNDEAASREIIKEVSAKVKAYIARGEINEANTLIQSYKSKCDSLKSSKLCLAGLNFHQGYLFQQAAKLKPDELDDFQFLAVTYYEKVLETFPGNKSSLDNLIKLNDELNRNTASVKWVMNFVEQFPSKTVWYFLRIGNLFLKDKNFEMACDYYKKAYEKDPRSERACNAVVNLYTRRNYACAMVDGVREFALDCKVIGLPNYSEELLRKEFIVAVQEQQLQKATQSMILWAYVLAENNWLYPEKVKRTIGQLFPKEKELSDNDELIKKRLEQLNRMATAETIEEMGRIGFWKTSNNWASVSRDWEYVTPLHVLLKIYFAKGENAYFKNQFESAEKLWRAALDESYNFDRAFFTQVAIDLAKLYHSKPEMDRSDQKLESLVIELFDMKGAAYRANDLKMIRNYHITLGGIFYDKQIWDGAYARNARFQLERALSTRLGPIINPKLREMLGVVYDSLGDSRLAIESYGKSIQDYLSLDRIKEAETLHEQIKTTRSLNPSKVKKYDAMEGIITWRKAQISPDNSMLRGTMPLPNYLDNALEVQTKAKDGLPSDFVDVQIFKGLSDLGAQLGDDRTLEQQIVYSNALNKINTVNELSSEEDYYRTVKANNALLLSLEESNKMQTVRMYGKELNYVSGSEKTKYNVLSIPTLNKEIAIPEQLLLLNKTLQTEYKNTNTKDLAKYKMIDGRFELVKAN